MVTAEMKKGHLVTKVSDTGLGIKEEELSSLFTFFGKL